MTTQAMTGAPEKLLVEFIAEFINNEGFRFNVLRREITTMRQYGLTENQIATLMTLESGEILAAIKAELIDWGADVDALDLMISMASRGAAEDVLSRVKAGTAGLGAIRALAASASMYAEGQIHIRKVLPESVSANQQVNVELQGHGFDVGQNTNEEAVTPEVRFSKLDANGTPESNVFVIVSALDVTVDQDLFQHVSLQVTLPVAGTWVIDARNMDLEPWHAQDHEQSRIVAA